ncbi:MAG: S-methyl-5-thioribose-1-phosphate isomerase [Candidatus Omnitrophota bacterium]
MSIPTIEWKNNRIRLVDQTRLPGRLVYAECRDLISLWHAIKTMKVRGAPAIGIAVALGVLLASEKSRARNYNAYKKEMLKAIRYLATSRPTARNLFWALEKMEGVILLNKKKSIKEIKSMVKRDAQSVVREDKEICRRMARHGVRLVNRGDNILTHCNAGGLATADYGTALGVLFEAKKLRKNITVYADETRPLLQGARLTSWELKRAGIKTVLICDNMAASLMAKGRIDKIFVGADRIARNGDTANKIGTYNLAILARFHKIPFYVVAPTSTIDLSLKTGREIPIEERDPREVLEFGGVRVAPMGVKVCNPAFDVTPNTLISAIITEKGIFRKRNGRFGQF